MTAAVITVDSASYFSGNEFGEKISSTDSSPGAALSAALPGDELFSLQTAPVVAVLQPHFCRDVGSSSVCPRIGHIRIGGLGAPVQSVTSMMALTCEWEAMGRAKTGGAALINDAPESTVNLTDGVPESVGDFLQSQANVTRAHFLARLLGRNPVPRCLRAKFCLASADVAVIDVLSQLSSDWLVRTPEPVSGEGMEHVLIGPSGIFSMIVRHRVGVAVWIDGSVLLADGERLPDLRDAEFSAVRLTQIVSDAVGTRVGVTPCLVLAGQRSLTVAKPPRRVAVMTVRDIRTWLKGMPTVLSPQHVQAAHAGAIAQPGWHAVGDPQAPSREVLDKFRKVQSEVSQARHLRLTWVTGVLVLLWLIVVVGIGGVTTSFLVA